MMTSQRMRTRLDGRSEYVTVVRIPEIQALDKRLVASDDAIRNRLDHQRARARQPLGQDIRSAFLHRCDRLFEDAIRPLRLDQATLRYAHQQITLRVANQDVSVVDHDECHDYKPSS
jgi:hypothetical protein